MDQTQQLKAFQLPSMQPRPKRVSVNEAIVVTCLVKTFIKIETTEPQIAASEIPKTTLKQKKLIKMKFLVFRFQDI